MKLVVIARAWMAQVLMGIWASRVHDISCTATIKASGDQGFQT